VEFLEERRHLGMGEGREAERKEERRKGREYAETRRRFRFKERVLEIGEAEMRIS
jgi:hypothetical protein